MNRVTFNLVVPVTIDSVFRAILPAVFALAWVPASSFGQVSIATGTHTFPASRIVPRSIAIIPQLGSLFGAEVEKNREIVSLPPVEADVWLGMRRVIAAGESEWRYLDTETGPPDEWIDPGFDASQWKKGKAPLGYGESTVVTKIEFGNEANKYPAAFFRLDFSIKKETHSTWAIRASVDDGAVFYLNGEEIHRIRMPEGKIKDTTRPVVKAGASSGLEQKFVTFDVDSNALKDGKNVLCVSVHQADADSSDLFLDVELLGLRAEEFAALDEKEEQQEQLVELAKLAEPPVAPVAAIGVAQPASLLSIFDARIKPEQSRLRHMLESLPRVIGITDDQVEELALASEDAMARLRRSIEERSAEADQAAQNLLRNEIYQNKISLTNDEELVETFAAILTPSQLAKYSKFVAEREEERLSSTIEMFYANLNCGIFLTEEQRPKMLGLLREIATDPATAKNYASTNNPISAYYRIVNGFSNIVRSNDPRLNDMLTPKQLVALNEGITSGSIYGGQFINVDRVLAPEEQ